jgi:hypothetical protein
MAPGGSKPLREGKISPAGKRTTNSVLSTSSVVIIPTEQLSAGG